MPALDFYNCIHKMLKYVAFNYCVDISHLIVFNRDLAMILCDPYAVNTVATSAIKTMHQSANNEAFPRVCFLVLNQIQRKYYIFVLNFSQNDITINFDGDCKIFKNNKRLEIVFFFFIMRPLYVHYSIENTKVVIM